MKLWNKRSARDLMVGSIWLSFFITVPLARHMTIPTMSWWEASKFCGIMCAFCTPVFAALGYMTNRLNIRKRYGYDALTWQEARFLDSLEVQVEEGLAEVKGR